jgi:DNA-binding SARP family transcriptional activator
VPRHRTLREAIDWSYRLLDDSERALLHTLSTFAGDFTLHAAETVVADAGIGMDPADVLDTLGALVDKSLVVMREAEGTARFNLLETVRQYAYARLKESGNLHRVCARHARTYMELVAEAAPHFITRDRPEWVNKIQRELDNIRVALACTREGDKPAHLRLLGDLGWFWYSSGHWSEGRRWMEGGLAIPATTDTMRAARADVLLGAGVVASLQSDLSHALPWLEESAALYRAAGDLNGEAYALAYHGVCYGQTGDERAAAPTIQALEHFRRSGDKYGLRLALVVLATTYAIRGDVERARAYGEEGVAVAQEFGLQRELGIALQVLGGVSMALGDVRRAADLYSQSIAALRRDPSLFWIQRVLQMLATATFRLGGSERGARLLGASEVVSERLGAGLFGYHREQLLSAIGVARSAIGDAAFEAARHAGRAMSLEAALSEATEAIGPEPSRKTDVVAAPTDLPPLDVRALGPLTILRDGAELPPAAWRYARPRELLLYLLSHPEGRTREQIGLVFFPDASPTQVKNNFHVMLHHVRKALGRAELITFERDRYRINWEVGVRFDAREFETAVRSERLEAAVAGYHGDFLADESAGDWHLEIRDHLRRLFVEAVTTLGKRDLSRSNYKEAAAHFRRAVAADELNEDAQRRLMLSLARAGERNEAMRQYERLAQVLRGDLEAEPERETKTLYERLKRAEAI